MRNFKIFVNYSITKKVEKTLIKIKLKKRKKEIEKLISKSIYLSLQEQH